MAMLPKQQHDLSSKLLHCQVEWQRQNKASVHRPAKEFANDRKRVHEWRQLTHGGLGKCCRLRCGQPLSVDLEHRVSGGQEKHRQIGAKPASVTVCNYNVAMSRFRRGPERGGVFAR